MNPIARAVVVLITLVFGYMDLDSDSAARYVENDDTLRRERTYALQSVSKNMCRVVEDVN